jgi:hypothetical protein
MTTLDGNPATKIVYLVDSETPPEEVLKRVELVSIKDGTRYHFVFGTDANRFNSFEPTFRKMIDSIRMTEPIGIFH